MPSGNNSITQVPWNITAQALAHNFSQEEETRRNEMQLNRDFYYDKQLQSLTLINEDQEPVTINLTKPIITKRSSLLYSNKLVREYDGPSASVKLLEAIYEDNDIDALLLQADLLAELTGSALITPVLDPTKPNGIKLKMYGAHTVAALGKEEDPSVPDAISIIQIVDRLVKRSGNDQHGEVQRMIKQQLWTDDAVVTYEGNAVVNSETNELGFIPFANFKGSEVYDQYFGHSPARQVRMANETINNVLTDLGFAIKFQSFTPIAVAGMSGDTLVTMHPGRALNLPAGATADVLNTDPKLMEVLEFLKWLEEKTYETSGVPMISVVGGGEANSGRELMVRWYPLLKVFNEKAKRFQKYELELANVILRFLDMEPLVDVNVGYRLEDVLPITEEEDTFELDIKYNIKTPIDEVMKRDPNLTEAEAQAIVFANRDINQELTQTSDNAQEEVDEEGNPIQPEVDEDDVPNESNQEEQ